MTKEETGFRLSTINQEPFAEIFNKPNSPRPSFIQALRLPTRARVDTLEKGVVDDHDAKLINEVAAQTKELLNKNYASGFGVFPSSSPKDNFYGQIWARDLAHALGNYHFPEGSNATLDSLNTIFRHQKQNGMLPFRVEKEYALIKLIPGIGHLFAMPLFNLIEGKFKQRSERPVFEGQDFSGAEDTIPSILITAGEFFINSESGKQFARDHFEQFKKAIAYFKSKIDDSDGLAVISKLNPDWADSIKRTGKLGTINILWARSLRMMEYMANQLGDRETARIYRDNFELVKRSIMSKLYNEKESYFRAAEGEDRIDTVASIFGSLYLLPSDKAVKVQETLKRKLLKPSGLQNFYPPYPDNQVFAAFRLIGHANYHNDNVWPWVTCQNIQVKIKIAVNHSDPKIQKQYQQEAIDDLLKMAKLYKELDGAYEIVEAEQSRPPKNPLYIPPNNFMGSMAAYLGAYQQIQSLGWL